jgi:hypothetical protein
LKTTTIIITMKLLRSAFVGIGVANVSTRCLAQETYPFSAVMIEVGTGNNINMFEVQASHPVSPQHSNTLMQAVPWMETSLPFPTLMCQLNQRQVLYGGGLLSMMRSASSL